jgi:MraZ protein
VLLNLPLTGQDGTSTIGVDFSGPKWSKRVLRGSYSARIDEKGRLKIPNAFKALVEDQHGAGLYITSLTGESVRIYPMPVWLAVEQRIARMPSTHPARLKFLDRVNYYGQAGEFDGQGRVVIPSRARDAAGMSGEVDVLGVVEYLEVWNHDRFVAKLHREAFTDDDARALAEFGI